MKSLINRVSQQEHEQRQRLDKNLSAYLASAGFVGAAISASDVTAAVVGNNSVVQFGPANGGPGNIDIPIDIDSDGEQEFALRHITNSNGEDYLELDKSPDENSAFPDLNGDGDDDFAEYVNVAAGDYPAALPAGVSGGTKFTPPAGLQYEVFQDSSNYLGLGTTRRANRLIDYDSGVDETGTWNPPAGNGNFVGLGGVPHYVAVQMDFDDAGPLHYGWIGVRITDDATASGELIGFAYETAPATPITMGVVPEPGTMALAALGGITLAGSWITRRISRK